MGEKNKTETEISMITHCYVDTSVLLVYTLACGKETERFPHVEAFFELVENEMISATTSFYALHELYVFALENAPDFEIACKYGKEAINKILSLKVQLTPLLDRMERIINARLFKKLSDKSDLPHAISAKNWGCDIIIAYDDHFQSITDIIDYKRPEEIISIFHKKE